MKRLMISIFKSDDRGVKSLLVQCLLHRSPVGHFQMNILRLAPLSAHDELGATGHWFYAALKITAEQQQTRAPYAVLIQLRNI